MNIKKSLKMRDVISNSSLDATLIRSVVSYHGGWDQFKSIAPDICSYGANTGISFIYYVDSVKFFRNHAPAIKRWISEFAENELGGDVVKILKSWDLLRGYNDQEILMALYAGKGDAVDQVYDACVKALVENVAYWVVDTNDLMEGE